MQHAEQMQGVGVVRFPGQNRIVAARRVGETTRLMQLPRVFQVS